MKAIIVKNNLVGCDYAEPYCGGAGVAIELLTMELINNVHINDVDPAINSFWNALLTDPDTFCSRVSRATLSIRAWQRHKSILKDAANHSLLDVGFAAFYLNRVNRSGILTAGPIGGIRQQGAWLMDARFNKSTLISVLQSIARFRDRITVYSLDARKFLSLASKWGGAGTLCYLDPPYVVQGKRLYRNFYTDADHLQISRIVRKLNLPWIVSYDNVDLIQELYAGFRSIKYGIGYSANVRSIGSEIMIFSDVLRIPLFDSPLGLSNDNWRSAGAAA